MSDHHSPLLSHRRDPSLEPDATRRALRHVHHFRRRCRVFLASREKHFLVMGLVTIDVMALLANIFIKLIACEMKQADEEWVKMISEYLESTGLFCSCLFMIELIGCLFAFGFSYLSTFFHLFDAAVILLSFAIDIASQGLAEDIGSLIVVLRLWRLAKISEEVVMGATERLELMEQQMVELEKANRDLEIENEELRQQLGIDSHEHSGQD